MTAGKVILLRHGLTDWNAAGRFQGQADIELNTTGREQAAAAATVLAKAGITRIVSSDLRRAAATASAVATAVGLPVNYDSRLQEVNVGTWAGLTTAEVGEREPDFWPAVQAGRDFPRSATGETATQAGERVAAALVEHAESCGSDDVLLAVGHGLALRVALLTLIGLGYPQARWFAGFGNCHWAVAKPLPEHWRLIGYNLSA